MIAWLEGKLREKAPTRVIVDVNGVGYELLVSLQTFESLPAVAKTVSLHVRTVVREDAFLLYGFAAPLERDAFDLLVRANRVGPRLAQAILSGVTPEALLRALCEGDAEALQRAPGVGPKMAQRMSLELHDGAEELVEQRRLPAAPVDGGTASPVAGDVRDELLSALMNLGYPRNQAERVADQSAREAGEGASIESLIRVALQRLSR
ncbi:MAG: Holliday junction branch migration protein RuvA [Myxococcota bacterium]|jgi:holliday junction DNA helicase RuvA|nr:Holliday junction branch migration protein RuvA [Myxococcota bacterium]